MWSLSSWLLLGVVSVLAAKVSLFVVRDFRLKSVMPPSPAISRLLSMYRNPKASWTLFTELRDELGPVFSLHFAGRRIVILNNLEATASLLHRRSAVYSDRPAFIMAGNVITGGLSLTFLRYGDRMRRMRRAVHEGLNERSCNEFHALLEKRVAILVSRFLEQPHGHDQHFRWFSSSAVLGSLYGWREDNPAYDAVTDQAQALTGEATAAVVPGKYLVEFFPWLLYLPAQFAKWKRKAQTTFSEADRMFGGLMKDVEARVQEGTSPHCFAAGLVDEDEFTMLNAQERAWLAGTMFAGGSDTIMVTLGWFGLAMVLNPSVQRRAQLEIDNVVGRDRLPALADRPNLPYVDALVKEVLRWRPPVPLSIPRTNTQDDWYDGYFIPKGSLIICNVWACNRDPKHFPDYNVFRPERYLDASGNLDDTIADTHGLGHLSYGSGRRQCPGAELANRALFIAVATILWSYDLKPCTDTNGVPVPPSAGCLDDNVTSRRPPRFDCQFVPRSAEVAAQIASTVENRQE